MSMLLNTYLVHLCGIGKFKKRFTLHDTREIFTSAGWILDQVWNSVEERHLVFDTLWYYDYMWSVYVATLHYLLSILLRCYSLSEYNHCYDCMNWNRLWKDKLPIYWGSKGVTAQVLSLVHCLFKILILWVNYYQGGKAIVNWMLWNPYILMLFCIRMLPL